MTDTIGYKHIKKLYRDSFGIPPRIVDLLSVSEILQKCVSGLSNDSIVTLLGEDERVVSEAISKYLGFSGFTTDLDISIILVYNKTNGSVVDFRNDLKVLCSEFTDEQIMNMFNYCHKYILIGKEIEYYDK